VTEKAALYADAGIRSYWRAEFEPEPRLVVMQLRDGRHVGVEPGGRVTVHRPCDVTVEV
jgi:hypothetical protein